MFISISNPHTYKKIKFSSGVIYRSRRIFYFDPVCVFTIPKEIITSDLHYTGITIINCVIHIPTMDVLKNVRLIALAVVPKPDLAQR